MLRTMLGADPRVLNAPPGRGLTGRTLLRALAAGAAALPFASRPMAEWADRLPDGWDTLRAAFQWWDGAMAQLGLTAPYETLHGWARLVVAAAF